MSAPVTWQAAVRAWVVAGSGIEDERVIWADHGAPRPTTGGPWISLRELAEESGGDDWLRASRRVLAVNVPVASVNAGANTLVTSGAHGLRRGDGPIRLTTTGTAPGGLAVDVDYWAMPIDATSLRLSSSFLGAVETGTPIDLSGAGTGAMHLVGTSATVRAGAEIERAVAGTRTTTVSIQCYGGASTDANGAAARLKRTLASLSLPSIQASLRRAHVGLAPDQVGPIQNIGAVRQTAAFEPRAAMTVQIHVPIVDASEPATVIETVEPEATLT